MPNFKRNFILYLPLLISSWKAWELAATFVSNFGIFWVGVENSSALNSLSAEKYNLIYFLIYNVLVMLYNVCNVSHISKNVMPNVRGTIYRTLICTLVKLKNKFL